MERISTNGEIYVKASSIARELGYTSDYVGQLARGGKIGAQLVGRSWFVNEDDIRAHKSNRYRRTSAAARRSLREAIRSRAAGGAGDAAADVSASRALYEMDETAVLPALSGEKPAAEAGNVPIRQVFEVDGEGRGIDSVTESSVEENLQSNEGNEEETEFEVEFTSGGPLSAEEANRIVEEHERKRALEREQYAPIPIKAAQTHVFVRTRDSVASSEEDEPESNQNEEEGIMWAREGESAQVSSVQKTATRTLFFYPAAALGLFFLITVCFFALEQRITVSTGEESPSVGYDLNVAGLTASVLQAVR